MYLDPGSGSLIFQIILAGLLGISVFIKIYWQKIINLFKLNKRNSKDQEKVSED